MSEPKVFITEDNVRLEIIPGLRDKLRPGWKNMFIKDEESAINHKCMDIYREKFTRVCIDLCNFLHTNLKEKKSLEIGCSYGFISYLLAELGSKEVVGIDIPEYNINQSGLQGSQADIEKENRRLNRLRKLSSVEFSEDVINRVKFYNVDATQMTYDNEFDIIVSLDTLEHISNPLELFKRMCRALKSGGFMWHVYNPFFSFTGGHSLCTTDLLWGHCILSRNDFIRYIQTYRSEEANMAIPFYDKCLNRLTISELNELIAESGLKLVGIYYNNNTLPDPFPPELLAQLFNNIIPLANKHYPNTTINDFLFDSISFTLEKN